MKDYKSVRIYPIFKRAMYYNDHYDGNVPSLWDTMGRDCHIASFDAFANQTSGFMKLYRNDGSKNEDWYTFDAEVLSPIDGKVTRIYINPNSNNPGYFIPSEASSITITREDGVNIVLAYIKDPLVKEGDEVKEGQVIAYAGNNGCSRSPHVHIGGWKDDEPLQIEFDLYKMGELVREVGEIFYVTGMTEEEFLKINENLVREDNGQ